MAISDRALEEAFAERRDASGAAEFGESLRAAGQTVADVELEVAAELASAALRRKLTARAAEITQPEVIDLYQGIRDRFRVPEVRLVDLIENLPSESAAAALVRRVGAGRRFAKMAYHEALQRVTGTASDIAGKGQLVRAIFAARRGEVSPPMPLNHAWTVFVVRKIDPAGFKPLSKVRSTVVDRLSARRRSELVEEFGREFRRRWTAQTSCRPGYVAQGCLQYAGSLDPEDSLFGIY